MADEKILIKIRDAEAKAEKTIADAHIAKQKAIEATQKKANDLRNSASEKISKDSDEELKVFYAALAKKREKILSECSKDAAALRKDGEKKMPKAVDFLFESFKAKVSEQ